MPASFQLDPRLERSSVHLGDWDLSQLRLKNDARFPWLLLIPRQDGVRELTDLDPEDYLALTREIRRACGLLQELARPEKLNVATLGNMVAQMHVHVIGRFAHDPAWPDPVWCHGDGPPYDAPELERLVDRYARAAGCR